MFLSRLFLCDIIFVFFFFFSSRRRHTRFDCDWSSDVCSSDLPVISLHHGRWAKNIITYCGLSMRPPAPAGRSEERRVGKSVDLGGRRIIKKKKNKKEQQKKTRK